MLLLLSDRKISLELLDNRVRLVGGDITNHNQQLSLVETLVSAICRSRDVMHKLADVLIVHSHILVHDGIV